MGKPTALVLPPQSRLDEVCSSECVRLLNKHFEPVWNQTGRDFTEEELAGMIGSVEVVLTSWGSPKITEQMLEKSPKLRMIGHAAGTVKGRIPSTVFAKRIKVFSAAPRIAHSVGEYCLSVLLASLRHIPAFHDEMRAGQWRASGRKGRELAGQTIGIVSASSTARAFIQLLAPFRVTIKVFDPHLSDEAAATLGVTRASLEEVMSCPIVSIHAPKLPATYRMITRELIERIPDGALFINSSRTDVLDEEALLEQLQSGRFFAALDVFSREPVHSDSPFLALNNVILTPHVAGATVEGHLSLMEEVVRDMVRCLEEETTCFEVTERMWETIA
ncbi:hydroxyacid dehydrogenase [Paenibacillus xerothermodurans]|uniref:Hydroxyacid dehydrogenase n=1 Tax=Paenibacillus xerothermodurans TaxID=1977292 RepID=A0A2W1NEF4_PAEXE|nr:hydroxyacid dehydrogenase [Paenibacillus xerothermodurans]PZE22314.1 hydroxyacid dehydrogenase [Paenibacillus xerothermodurans]